MTTEINKNMVRERALKLPVVTEEMYKKCNYETREIVEEFFAAKSQLSKDTKTQYKSEKYPFACDFYIPEIDTYIEYQGSWTHGKEPYLGTSKQLEKVKLWESKNTRFYTSAIKTWTITDVLKRKIAKDNKLKYLEFFSIKDFNNWFIQL